MIYCYECTACGHPFEVIKSLKDIDAVEVCPACDSESTNRVMAPSQALQGLHDWNQKDWNPALGGAYTPKEAQKEAKRRGLTEIGNEPPDKIHKHFDSQREQKLKDSYARI